MCAWGGCGTHRGECWHQALCSQPLAYIRLTMCKMRVRAFSNRVMADHVKNGGSKMPRTKCRARKAPLLHFHSNLSVVLIFEKNSSSQT